MMLKDFLKNKQWKKWRKDQWLIVFLAGVLVLVVAMPVGNKKDENKDAFVETLPTVTEETSPFEEQIENRLEEILQTIEGVGKVKVMITFKDYGETVVEKDTEVTYSSTENKETQRQSKETTIYENLTEEAGPFIAKENTPKVEGVLVAAQGGGNAIVAQNISEAIQALFDIEIHKIKIVKMNAQEGTT